MKSRDKQLSLGYLTRLMINIVSFKINVFYNILFMLRQQINNFIKIFQNLQQKMLIFLREANGNGFSIKVQGKDKVNMILGFLQQKNDQIVQKYQVYFKGKIVDCLNESFLNLNVKQNDILHIIKANNNTEKQQYLNLNIFYNNDTYSFRISNKQNIYKLKHKIYDHIMIHPRQQYLIFRGKKLPQTSTFIQEKIQNNALITLIYIQKKQSILKLTEHLPCSQNQLLESITSLKIKRTQSQCTKASLFRSDSLGNKVNQEHCFPQIQVKYTRDYVDLAASIQSQMEFGNLLYNNDADRLNHQIIADRKKLTFSYTDIQKGSFSNLTNQQQMYRLSEQINQDMSQKSSQSLCDEQSLYKKLKLEQNSLFQSMQFGQMQPQTFRFNPLHRQKQIIQINNPQSFTLI